MDKIKGLQAYVASEKYRKALGLPEQVCERYELLAQGEYNVNYLFTHPVSQEKMLLRVNCGSQMHLDDQIGYEYRALKLLEKSGRTPRAIYVDGSKEFLDHGVMVMEFLPGRVLDYHTDMELAAECLADIHSTKMEEHTGLISPEHSLKAILEECEEMVKTYMDSPLGCEETKRKIRILLDYHTDMELAAECLADIHSTKMEEHTGLISPEHSLKAILEECEEMVKTYMDSPLGCEETKRKIRILLDSGWKLIEHIPAEQMYRCCINTELNSTNFLINGEGENNYLIDWEKPLYGDPAQDLGHFLAPTTTFWKTDVILDEAEMNRFIDQYIAKVNGRFPTEGLRDRVFTFVKITCLRGITWCAMAWVEYQQPDKLIFNESTFQKLGAYLEHDFLDRMNF